MTYFKESLKAFWTFWSSFFIFTLVSLSFLLFYYYSEPIGLNLPSESGIKLGSLYLGLLFLVFLVTVFEYPKVSISMNKKMSRVFFMILAIYSIISVVFLGYRQTLEKLYPQFSYLLPIFAIIGMPILNQLIPKILDFKPSRVFIRVPSKAKLFSTMQQVGIKKGYYYEPHENDVEKGLPISITNKTKESILITHINLEIIHPPFLVPLSAMRRFGRLDAIQYKLSYLNHEYPLESPLIIKTNEIIIIHIPKSEIDKFIFKIQNNGEEYGRTFHPVYINIIDAYNDRTWTSEMIYYPTFLWFFPEKWK